MKKGDVIEKRKEIPSGTVLIRNCPNMDFAEDQMLHIEKHYNFSELPRMKIVQETPGQYDTGLHVVLDQDSSLTIQAKVNWVVEDEVAIEYLDTGGMIIINIKEEMGWVVVHESTPVYQDSVEHMTDEQLRESIELLRSRRVQITPTKVKKARSAAVSPVESAEDKALASVLGNMDEVKKLELMRKLGLVD